MAHPLETGPLPDGWVSISTEYRAELTKRLLEEQPRMALLTQLRMEVVARHARTGDVLVRSDMGGTNFFVTRLTGRQQDFGDCAFRSVDTPKELNDGLQAAS